MELQIKSLYSDFFQFIIWDTLKPLFRGLSVEIPFKNLKNTICNIFVEGALHYKVDYLKITEILKKYNLSDALIDYIIDLISKFANQLDGYFLKDQSDIKSVYTGKEFDNILYDFNNIINEIVLVSYFDLIVLKQAGSLLVYASDLSLADIYQWRMECLELFKSALIKDSSLLIAELLKSVSDKLREITLNEKIINLIKLQFTSFFEFLVTIEDLNTVIPLMKNILSHEIFDYRQISSLIPSNDLEIITEWFKRQVIDLPIILLEKSFSADFTFEFDTFKNEISELFKFFINGTITYDIFEKRLHDMEKSLGYLELLDTNDENIFEFLELEQSQELVKSYPLQKIRTKFDFNIPKLQKLAGTKNFNQKLNFVILYRVFKNILSYCQFIEEEKKIDPSLNRLILYIKTKIQSIETLYI